MARPQRARSNGFEDAARGAKEARRGSGSSGRAEARLRRYVRALQLDAFRRGRATLLTIDELAGILDLDPEACRRALVRLSCSGEIEVIIYPGGRCELQPGRALPGGPRPGRAADPHRAPGPDRVLATVLFTDIVGSTERAATLGDRRWRGLLERHNATVRRELARFGGREIDAAGDGFLAVFDAPARAVRCACAVAAALRWLGIIIRVGVHAGECELIGERIGGIAVHLGARIAALAAPGEVLVSRTVKDLVSGADLRFRDRGVHALKGIPGEWRLFAADCDEDPRLGRPG